jgi:hypothetical protein
MRPATVMAVLAVALLLDGSAYAGSVPVARQPRFGGSELSRALAIRPVR